MKLPLHLPPTGQRVRLDVPAGSADALALTRLARECATLVIVTETAWDAGRLADEMAYFAPDLQTRLFPDWETLPYDSFSPHQDLVSERLATLYHLSRGECRVLVVPATTASYRLTPAEYLAAHTFFIRQKERLDTDALRAQLTLAGYTHTQQVMARGEYAVRGSLIDLFPMGSPLPYRLDLFGDEVEKISAFDPDTQRSVYPVAEIRLLPAREFPLDEAGVTRFRQNFRARFEGDPSRVAMYKDVSNGLAPAGVEYFLPLFFDGTATLFDYAPRDAVFVVHHDVEAAIQAFWKDTASRHRLLAGDRSRPVLDPPEIFLTVDEFFGRLKQVPRVDVRAAGPALPPLTVDRKADNPAHRLAGFVEAFSGRVLVVAEGLGRRETMAEYLAEYGLVPEACGGWAHFVGAESRFMLGVAPLAEGFVLPDEGIAVVTETELYAVSPASRAARGKRRETDVEGMLRDLSEVRVGDPVVHAAHGIGRYLGLVTLDLGDGPSEFLKLEYADADVLYVPVAALSLISRYAGTSPEAAPLHKLGSGQWDKAKRRAMQRARDTAAELLNLYARRAARAGYAFGFKAHDYEAFADGFGFDETPDQASAIEAVVSDMRSGKPMDRLVCGDVGFGKTEVALRAAFVAVADGKQVAVLVPTTLLAEQHFNTFNDRFADWPVRIAELSRFRSQKEVEKALAGLRDGSIDIVIGTHKLLEGGIDFARLGLAVIDEEHRFGVRQKERLKALRAEVDVLTLTATPIPRSLALALESLRDFSVIATAPEKRLAIKTFVSRFSEGLIREAVLRELKRGGQVYYLHNEVETIAAMQERLAALLPEARTRIAHGQMPERELEAVMRDFYHQRFNLLLCTTIIETGIDVPTANTIVINRADKFGLAQLHQLRGRVGRSHHQAYAFLLTPEDAALTANARKRLEAIQMLEELGSGFHLAMHDLEIRGAGEVLGEKQSGDMEEIGFSLYTEMLTTAVEALKAGREPDMEAPLAAATEINLHAPALLPDTYCPDVHERLVLYKRLSNCRNDESLALLGEELIDRFGLMPEPAKTLIETHRLRLRARTLGICKADSGPSATVVQFVKNPPIDPARIIAFVQANRDVRLAGPDRIRVEREAPAVVNRIALLSEVIRAIGD